jgi:hypothetical protein
VEPHAPERTRTDECIGRALADARGPRAMTPAPGDAPGGLPRMNLEFFKLAQLMGLSLDGMLKG